MNKNEYLKRKGIKSIYHQTISLLPDKIRKIVINEANILLRELESHYSEWGLNEKDGMYYSKEYEKVLINWNIEWYSELYQTYKQHHRLKFDRECCINSLDRIINLKDKKFTHKKEYKLPYVYDVRMRKFIFDRLTEGQDIQGKYGIYKSKPNNEIRKFFELEEIIFEEENEEIEEKKEEIKLEDIPF